MDKTGGDVRASEMPGYVAKIGQFLVWFKIDFNEILKLSKILFGGVFVK